MRKNKMMRIASVLLVAVLLTTCAISGTFAKYVTTASGTNSARVAKWGVMITGMGDSLFSNTYAKDTATSIDNTVVATEKVVAPGTKNESGVTFSLTGTPEVAVKIDIKVTASDGTSAPIDVVLPEHTGYTDYTQAPYTGTFDVAADYHPVVFTLKDGSNVLKSGTLAEIKSYLEAGSKEYDPRTDLSKIFSTSGTGTYTLTWAWAFDNAEHTNDKADTYLGNVAANTPDDIAKDGVSTSIDFAIAITATQID